MRRFGGLRSGIIQSTITRFSPSNRSVLSFGGCGGSRFYSATLRNEGRPTVRNPSTTNLSQRIRQVRGPKASIFPIVEQWDKEGNYVDFSRIHLLIKELRRSKRNIHALQIFDWLTHKSSYVLSSSHVAIQLDLITKVHGIEKSEDHFNSIPTSLKNVRVYGSLLHCYISVKSMAKAEVLWQKMRVLGFTATTMSYNAMLNLYYKTGNARKADTLIREMCEKGIGFDRVTYSTVLSAYASVSYIEGMENILTRMENDPKVVLRWPTYALMSSGYRKVGLLHKALEMLNKAETLIGSEMSMEAYNFLMTQYAGLRKKDEVLRIWELYKMKHKAYHGGYLVVLSSLLKFDEIEIAEKIFEEWEFWKPTNDIRVVNVLFRAYARKGLLLKAETLINKVISNGGIPVGMTHYHLAITCVRDDQPMKAVDALKRALTQPGLEPFKLHFGLLAASLSDFKADGELEKAQDFVKLLRENHLISSDTEDGLLHHIRFGFSNSDQLDVRSEDGDTAYVVDESVRILTNEGPPMLRNPSTTNLSQRIWQIRNPKASISHILEQWDKEGNYIDFSQIYILIKKVRSSNRYFHALQIFDWLTNKSFHVLSSSDIAIQLDLITKVHGIEKADDHFNSIPTSLKDVRVYGSLLHCYISVKSMEKAEVLWQKMRVLGFAATTMSYNAMLNLYYTTGNAGKADTLIREMCEKGVGFDRVTYSTVLSAYAAVSDIEGMEKILARMESDPNVVLGWPTYASVSSCYRKDGLLDKALEMLNKVERLIGSEWGMAAYKFFMTQYTGLGKKDEVLRIWGIYKMKHKVSHGGYLVALSSLLQFDDIEIAEKIFEEWESWKPFYNIRVVNVLIRAYARKGLLLKAETLVKKVISNGGKPVGMTYYMLAIACVRDDQPVKAVEALKKAIMQPGLTPFELHFGLLAASLRDFKADGELGKAQDFVKLLRRNHLISSDEEDGLLYHIRFGSSNSGQPDACSEDGDTKCWARVRYSMKWTHQKTCGVMQSAEICPRVSELIG